MVQNKDLFSFDVRWDYRSISFFVFLLALPNVLGMINISTPWGFKIHVFQFAIFLAAALYGPIGGMLSGLLGSVYSAVLMANPYIAVGNAILGFFAGLFIRLDWNTMIAVAAAFIIQLFWLVPTDLYLMHIPMPILQMLVVALLISNAIWALLAHITAPAFRKMVQ